MPSDGAVDLRPLSCQSARGQIPALFAGSVVGDAADRLRAHLAGCPDCQHLYDAYRRDSRALDAFLAGAVYEPTTARILAMTTQELSRPAIRWPDWRRGTDRFTAVASGILLVAAVAVIVTLILPGVQRRGASAPTARFNRADAPLLLVDQAAKRTVNDTPGLRARAVDPATLAVLPDRPQIDLGHNYIDAISPDGRTMAAIVWPVASGGRGTGGQIHLIDLATLDDTPTTVQVDENIGDLLFSADGRGLYYLVPGSRDQDHGVPRDNILYRFDLATQSSRAVVVLPSAIFVSWDTMKLLPDGRLAVWGIPTDANNLAEDAPHLFILDPDAGRVAVDLRLEGVHAGQFRTTEGTYESIIPALAWDLPRDRLYIAHADDDRITAIDLRKGVVVREEVIHPQASLADRLLGWFALEVAAKDNPSTTRTAQLSPDGTRLYIFGSRTEIIQDANGQRREQYSTTPLQVVATDTLREVGKRDPRPAIISATALSPDGRYLLLYTYSSAPSGTTAQSPVRLDILDAATLTEIGSIERPSWLLLTGFSPDGQFAYFSYPSTVNQDGGYKDWTMGIIELATGHLTAEHHFEGQYLGQFIVAAP